MHLTRVFESWIYLVSSLYSNHSTLIHQDLPVLVTTPGWRRASLLMSYVITTTILLQVIQDYRIYFSSESFLALGILRAV